MQDRSKVAPTSKKLDPSIHFDTIPACDRQRDRHKANLYRGSVAQVKGLWLWLACRTLAQ